ncbi:type II secretion system protein GspK [Bryobacter aggregatus]|uniref:type II secretion system protein GspK n=1 Tax=Bryobacter aggregatus TaxID=360054 RepID=UPI00138DE327|nr:type II secretion system protein GspK [Bryobacter aggregatus]
MIPIAKKKTQGTALLAVLWLTAALSTIAFSVADTVRAETERGIAAQESLRAYYLARGAVERTYFEIRNPVGDAGGSFTDRFAARRRMYLQEPTGDVLIELLSEHGKLPMRGLSPQLLLRLLRSFGESENDASAIVQKAFSATPPTMASTGQNSGAASAFRPAIASMENVEELLLVPGITSELVYGRYVRLPDGRLVNAGGLADCLSPYIKDAGPLDLYSVHPSLLEANGVSPETAREFAEIRRQAFQPLPALQSWLQRHPIQVRNDLGEVFQIRATARVRLPNGMLSETRRTVSLVLQFTQVHPRFMFINPWSQLRWYDRAFSDIAASDAVWNNTPLPKALPR